MKNCKVGGQALMEGVMMRNGSRYGCAVRKTDGEIVTKTDEFSTAGGSDRLRQIPFVRGVFVFLDSLKLGFSTLSWSSSFFMEEEETKSEKAEKAEKATMAVSEVNVKLRGFSVLPSLQWSKR